MKIKPVEFLGDALDALRSFPPQARRLAGFQVDRIQRGLEPVDWKPLLAVGKGVKEIRIWDEADIDLATDRYKALIRSKK
ncbi:MAG: hypothetical protein A2Z01_03005 [Betaproteobacteria bacterium RBG_16_58_11]|nr:MAG: hypothetical protein A2Z01_03005 [Betaproteobacteria bacterium RBG_16_58_11]